MIDAIGGLMPLREKNSAFGGASFVISRKNAKPLSKKCY